METHSPKKYNKKISLFSRYLNFLLIYAFLLLGSIKDSFGVTCREQFNKAVSLQKESNYSEALSMIKEAADCFFGEDNIREWLKAHVKANKILRNSQGNKTAAEYLDSVINQVWRPLTESEKRGLIWANLENGYDFYRIEDHYNSYLRYRRVIQLISEDCDSINYWSCYDRKILGKNVLFPLSKTYRKIGAYKNVLYEIPDEFVEEFRKVYDTTKGSDLAMFYVEKSLAYAQLEEYEKAIGELEVAYQIPNLDNEMQAFIKLDLGNVYRLMDQEEYLNRSLKELHFAEEIIRNSDNKGDVEEQTILAKIELYRTMTYRDQRKFVEAIQTIQKSIDYTKVIRNDLNHTDFSRLFLIKAKLLDSLGLNEEAMNFYNKALQTINPIFQDSHLYSLPEEGNLFPNQDLVDICLGKSNYWILNYRKSGDNRLLMSAIKAHKLAIQIEDLLRSIHPMKGSRFRISKQRNQRIAKSIEAAYELWSNSKSDSILEYVLYFMEKSRSQELQNELFKQKISLDQSEKIRSYYTSYRASQFDLAKAKKDLLEINQDSSYDLILMNALQESLDSIESQTSQNWGNFESALAEKYNDYFVKKSNPHVVQIPYIQNKIDSSDLFISFFNSNKFLYILYLSQNQIKFERVGLSKEFRSNLKILKNFLRTPILTPKQKSTYQNAAHDIYNKTIGPIKDWNVKRLLVVNCSLFFNLPLEVLLTHLNKPEETSSYTNWSYLWQTYEICYTFSATLFWERDIINKDPKLDYLGFAPDYGTDNYLIKRRASRGEVKELEFNSDEVWKSDSLYQNIGGKHEALYSYEATIESFRNYAGSSNVLHLAMHAFGGGNNYKEPYLLFCPDSGSTQNQIDLERYRLYISEIPTLDFSTELAILSACNSGLGRIITGEGVMNFGRAFRLAGIPNTVMSLWEVDDYSPSEIIPYFISNLQQGMSKTQALNEARRTYLESQNESNSFASPFYWAHFILVGNPDPMYRKQKSSIWSVSEQFVEIFYLNNPLLFWGSFLIVLSFVLYIFYLSFRQLLRR